MRTRSVLTALGASVALTLGAASGAGADVGPAAPFEDCKRGYICVYTGLNGTGVMQKWLGDDPNWLDGDKQFHGRVRSICNHGTEDPNNLETVLFYFQTNYRSYYASAGKDWCGNTQSDGSSVKLRSHKWVKA
ncbi:peptidase inhibitor family I36 protein [Streptomyces coeruleorubidus]|uniref:peptidase inhibitor family I36 protein n=1 Tax=Streptomyces coeruleorubidus TaxID=116188 RepID=UPI00237F6AD4|nr:peptidase inhibitor family I36 protein [Streptomyces coeruleorubidus]WDV52295.1 peptidase inhibitor family I36 protein [Streptomyces coeruleorubidus]